MTGLDAQGILEGFHVEGVVLCIFACESVADCL